MPPTATTMITSSATAQSQRASAAGRVWRAGCAGEVEICVIARPIVACGTIGKRSPARPSGEIHGRDRRSKEHTSELQSLMRISYAVFCLKKKNQQSLHPLPQFLYPSQ